MQVYRRIIQRYLGKISGPLLDRIDLHIEVPAVAYQEMRSKSTGASSAEMRGRVLAARARQSERGFVNANIPPGGCASSARWTTLERRPGDGHPPARALGPARMTES